MHLKLLLILSFFFLASCKENIKTIVVAGDSWAAYICHLKSLDKSLKNAGVNDALTNSTCPATTLPGARAEEWLESTFHKTTRVALMDASVKVLYFSIGGNDILNYWNRNMTLEQEQEVLDKVVSNIGAIITTYRMARPDIKIILSGYDFPRFIDNHPILEYKEAYERMGKPTPFELNSAVLRFSESVSKLADQKQVFYIHHFGLMHYHFGNKEEGLAPFTTLPPEMISAPSAVNQFGGAVEMMSDPEAMTKVGDVNPIIDAFHLSKSGYEKIADHTVMHYLKDWLTTKAPVKVK